MTNKEKAERYEALQMAIKVSLDGYIMRRDDAETKYNEHIQTAPIIGGYEKGLHDAYKNIVETLERWLE